MWFSTLPAGADLAETDAPVLPVASGILANSTWRVLRLTSTPRVSTAKQWAKIGPPIASRWAVTPVAIEVGHYLTCASQPSSDRSTLTTRLRMASSTSASGIVFSSRAMECATASSARNIASAIVPLPG